MAATCEATNVLMENCVWDGNCTRGIAHSWSAGSIKFLKTARDTVRRCQFINNDGPGLWFDYANSDDVIEQNFFCNNYGSGLMIEVSPNFDDITRADARPVMWPDSAQRLGVTKDTSPGPIIIRNNLAVRNRWDGFAGAGILLQMSSDCVVANNTCVGNEQFGIFVRYHPYDATGHRCVNNVLLNNLCVDNMGSQIYITPDPKDKPGFVAGNKCDYNLFFSTNSWERPGAESRLSRPPWPNEAQYEKWGKTEVDGTYSVEERFKIEGYDEHSLQIDPLFVSPATLDFRLQPGSPAISAGTKTDYITNDFFGDSRPNGRNPSIGAFEWFPVKPFPLMISRPETVTGSQ
jgi:parallel beta-helix repeat protein